MVLIILRKEEINLGGEFDDLEKDFLDLAIRKEKIEKRIKRNPIHKARHQAHLKSVESEIEVIRNKMYHIIDVI